MTVPYSKLSGKSRLFIGFQQLWLGPDHLLLVKSTRLSENYLRFYFSDIQAIQLREVPGAGAGDVTAAILLVLELGLAGLAYAYGWKIAEGVALGFAGFFAAMLILSFVRGARCICHIQTAVSNERLRPLSRLKMSAAVVESIRPRIEEVQGKLDPSVGVIVPESEPKPFTPRPEKIASGGPMLWTLFSFMTGSALVAALAYFTASMPLASLAPTLVAVEIGFLIAARRRLRSDAEFSKLSGLLTASAYCLLISSALELSYIAFFLSAFRNSMQAPGLRAWAGALPVMIFAVAWRVIAAPLGLVSLWRMRKPRPTPPPITIAPPSL